jgi:adenine phosphoribosyltransferase
MKTEIKNYIKDVPDFPKAGILFKDISPLLADPRAFKEAVLQIKNEWSGKIDAIAALDARGFLFGGALAYDLGLPLVMLRKKGKLPGKTVEVTYDLEYGQAIIEVEVDSFAKNTRVLVIDDLLATGGTAKAACELVEKTGAIVAGYAFIVELSALGGRTLLKGRTIQTLVAYEE